MNSDGVKKSVRTLGQHVFIVTDMVEISIKLKEIPKILCEK